MHKRFGNKIKPLEVMRERWVTLAKIWSTSRCNQSTKMYFPPKLCQGCRITGGIGAGVWRVFRGVGGLGGVVWEDGEVDFDVVLEAGWGLLAPRGLHARRISVVFRIFD